MERRRVAKKNSYFLKKVETIPVEAINALQFEKTKDTLERAYQKSPFYRELFDKARVKPERFRKLEDVGRFPFIEKQDLVKDQKENPPFGRRRALSHISMVVLRGHSPEALRPPHPLLRDLNHCLKLNTGQRQTNDVCWLLRFRF